MLTGSEIEKQVHEGNIVIDPFESDRVGPNSYDLTLGSKLELYQHSPDYHGGVNVLDQKKNNFTKEHIINSDYGYILYPGKLYLGCTNEIAGSDKYIPCIDGRSSLARLGISMHCTAGFGDLGFIGKWTLEIFCIEPVRIYKDTRVCQIYFEEPKGKIDKLYDGKYKGARGIGSSESYRDFYTKDDEDYVNNKSERMKWSDPTSLTVDPGVIMPEVKKNG